MEILVSFFRFCIGIIPEVLIFVALNAKAMGQDRLFERKYSLNVARLVVGEQEDTFPIDGAFFEHFQHSPIKEGDVTAHLRMVKTTTFLDVTFHLIGYVVVSCDRCSQPYHHPIDESYRIIYSFRPGLQNDEVEVMYTDSVESQLPISQELYDFVQVSVPIRKVAPPEIHTCDPSILALIKADEDEDEDLFDDPDDEDEDDWDDEDDSEDGDDDDPAPEAEIAEVPEEEPREIDPRWAALKKLRDQMN